MKTRKHRNPSFPVGIVVGAILGTGALVWWATRKTTASTLQAITNGRANAGIEPNREYLGDGSLSYHGDTQGRALTPAEIDAITHNPSQPLLPAEVAMLMQQRAALAAGAGRID